ncbi:hypothetical protein RJ55_07768 [Drechmeria coniospora]|nr:hypothetical protein RJ55_07768 [Drechmeria coniospora]
MPILGRHKAKPRDLHIRKVSLSGCSLSSGSSLSSTFDCPPVTPSTGGFAPLALHPPFQPPPRLKDRPLLSLRVDAPYDAEAAFFDHERRVSASTHEQTVPEPDEEHDCYAQPPPTSRWSDSTINSVDIPDTPDDDVELDEGEAFRVRPQGHQSMPNFSYKRLTATTKRPPMKSLSSLDDMMKRSGWKRRGVIFNPDDMSSGESEDGSEAGSI